MASDTKPVPGAEVARWRKKPVVIEAMEWDGTEACLHRALAFIDIASLPKDGAYVNPGIGYTPMMGTLDIPTLEGTITASPGDYIIRGVKGEYYPCKPDIFAATYEPADAALRASPEPAAPSVDATAPLRALLADARVRLNDIPIRADRLVVGDDNVVRRERRKIEEAVALAERAFAALEALLSTKAASAGDER